MANGKVAVISPEIEIEQRADLERLKKQINDAIYLLGGLLFYPTVGLAFSICHGLRAGMIAGTRCWLSMLREWGK